MKIERDATGKIKATTYAQCKGIREVIQKGDKQTQDRLRAVLLTNNIVI